MRPGLRVVVAVSASFAFFAITGYGHLQNAGVTREVPEPTDKDLYYGPGNGVSDSVHYDAEEATWICRISKEHGACGTRASYDLGDGLVAGMYCPEKQCCSKTACVGGSCGSWCSGNWALCSSSLVYHSQFSYGNCNCRVFAPHCDVNAACVHHNSEHGGVYCRCNDGYWGDGKTCKVDLCSRKPCGVGECERLDGSYRCKCPDGYEVVFFDGYPTCREKVDFCSKNPCGPEAMVKQCINRQDGYECECTEGNEVRDGRCKAIDLCASSPCGPLEGVHSCVTLRGPKLTYRCVCKRGYDLRLDSDGETQSCVKDWCYGNPCGPAERVASCNSNDTGYSCLCKEGYENFKDDGGRETCVRQDMCKQAPCGPPEAVEDCYSEGSSYRCRCKRGYTEVVSDGNRKCVEGDPCALGLCGPPEAVAECSTDGRSYTCLCANGYTQTLKEGQRVCVADEECTLKCGEKEAVKLCELSSDGGVKCTCAPGYILKYQGGTGKCVRADPCSVSPCGDPQAVRGCVSTGTSYRCDCNKGYTRRTLENGNQVCASLFSCAGQPCGPPPVAEACVTGEDGYMCKCRDGFVQSLFNGAPRCTLPEGGNKTKGDGDDGKAKSGGSNTTLKACAGVVGGLVLLGGIGAAIVYKKRHARPQGDNVEEEDADAGQPFLTPAAGASGDQQYL